MLSSPSLEESCEHNVVAYLITDHVARLEQHFKSYQHKGFGKFITCSACNNTWVSLALPGEKNPLTISQKKGSRVPAEVRAIQNTWW